MIVFSFFKGDVFFSVLFLISDIGASFLAATIVSFIKLQYKSIDLLASSLPGIGKSMPVGSELVSKIAIIGILSFFASATAVSYTHLTLPTNREV